MRRLGMVVLAALSSWVSVACSSGGTGTQSTDLVGGDVAVSDTSVADSGLRDAMAPQGDVVINEVLVESASGGPDWIELFNAGDRAVDLAGYQITDDDAGRAHLFTIPAGTVLAPGDFIVYEGKGSDLLVSMDFGFGVDEEAALLSPTGERVDRVDWQDGEAPRGASLGRLPDGSGSIVTLWEPTPGAPNRAGVEPSPDVLTGEDTPEIEPVGVVRVNELVAKDPDDRPDWVELINIGEADVDLGGWTLSDDETTPGRFVFPAGFTVEAGGFAVIEGKGSLDATFFDFGLGKEEGLWLYQPDGSLADATTWRDGEAPAGSSWGRLPDGDGAFQTLTPPSRGVTNVP